MAGTPEELCTIASIQAAEDEWEAIATDNQRKSGRFAIWVACLSPVAVFVLAIQLVFAREDHVLGPALVGLELVVLLILLVIGYAQYGPKPKDWASARVRTEVLRREKFLLKSAVGPYLHGDDNSSIIQERLEILTQVETPPVELLKLSDEGGEWRDHLEDAYRHSRVTEADCSDLMHDYFKNRIKHQQDFYRSRVLLHEGRNMRLEGPAKVLLVMAVAVSVVHLTRLATGTEASYLDHGMAVLALALPPVVAAITGWQSFFQSKRLALTFEHQAEALGEIATEMLKLEKECAARAKSPKQLTPEESREFALAFRRLVMRTEEVLAAEQWQWWILINSWSPGA